MSDPTYSFQFELTQDMAVEASKSLTQWAIKPTDRRTSRGFMIGLWVVVFFGCLFAFQSVPEDGALSLVVGATIAGILVGAGGSYAAQWVMYRHILKDLADRVTVDGPFVIRIWPDRITEEHQSGSRSNAIGRAEHVGAIRGASLISMGAFGYIVPDTALPNGVTGSAFRAEIQRYIEASP